MIEYPQVEIDVDRCLPYKYNQLDGSGKIFAKVDWVTLIFTDVSFRVILRWLKLTDCISEFVNNAFLESRGYDDILKFTYNGILLETSSFGFYGEFSCDLFDVTVPKLRVDISGSGLDFLRSIGVNFDTYRLTNPPELPKGATYHYSRIDIAYDFINYKADFLDLLIAHINKHSLPSGRIPLASTKGAIGVKIVTGDRKIVYLGSTSSERMLRVYDKRMQSINRTTGVYIKDNPYNNPDSWLRLEWQLRKKTAHNVAIDYNHDFKTLLKQVFEFYSMADGTVSRDRKVVDFWNELFPWREVESRIIQNENLVQYEKYEDRVLNNFFNIQMPGFIETYSILGREEFEKRVNWEIEQRFYNSGPLGKKRLQRFLCKFNQLSIADHLPNYSNFDATGLLNKDNKFYFRI